jgi:uncharacterized protein with FMN-binding domain
MKLETKIVVFKAKELIYTGIFVALGIVFIGLLVYMFAPRGKDTAKPTMNYAPGVYTSELSIADELLQVEVVVDTERIQSVDIKNMSETVRTMYPLLSTSLEEINEKIAEVGDIEELTFENNNQYTNELLKQAIAGALEEAK